WPQPEVPVQGGHQVAHDDHDGSESEPVDEEDEELSAQVTVDDAEGGPHAPGQPGGVSPSRGPHDRTHAPLLEHLPAGDAAASPVPPGRRRDAGHQPGRALDGDDNRDRALLEVTPQKIETDAAHD